MKKALLSLLSILFLIGCSKPESDIWTAVQEGNVEAVEYGQWDGFEQPR